MKTQFINTTTIKGIKRAECLHNSGKYLQPLPLPDYRNILVFIPRLEMIKLCDGVHNSVNEIFDCASCKLLLEK